MKINNNFVNALFRLGSQALSIAGTLVIFDGIFVGAIPRIIMSKEMSHILTTYGEVVHEVMIGFMASDYKKELIQIINKDGDYAYYNAVYEILKSNMASKNKIETIKIINEKLNSEKEEEES